MHLHCSTLHSWQLNWIFVQIWSKTQFWTKNASASASLRSATAFILASISVQIRSKNARAAASPRSAKLFILALIRSNSKQKCESFCITSLGQCVYFGFISFNFGPKMRALLPRLARQRRSNWANGIEELLNYTELSVKLEIRMLSQQKSANI